jgi:transcriptional regulator with XRE-family HTH domain
MDITDVLAPGRDLGAFIRAQRVATHVSLRELAKRAGISNSYLSQVERGLRRPSAEILAQIARGLQISVESLLTRAGILDDPGRPVAAAPEVVAALSADPILSDLQKRSLIALYGAFRREAEQLAAIRRDPTLGHPVPPTEGQFHDVQA